MHIFKDTKYDFLRWRWHAVVLSWVVILAGLAIIGTRGMPKGIEFAGGTSVIAQFDQAPSVEAVRAALNKNYAGGGQDAVVQAYGDPALRQVFYDELGIAPPAHSLEVGSGTHAETTARILERIEPVLAAEAPDWVVVYGDTNSTIAAALAIAGGALALAAERRFKAGGTNALPWKPTLKLATSGIYTMLRNPMYVGLLLLIAGIGIALASDWTLALLAPTAIVLHYGVVLREERYLEAKFGEDYRRYRASVPRWGIW